MDLFSNFFVPRNKNIHFNCAIITITTTTTTIIIIIITIIIIRITTPANLGSMVHGLSPKPWLNQQFTEKKEIFLINK
jgi:hypothetical protein